MTRFISLCLTVWCGVFLTVGGAAASDGTYLYKVSTLRADLGELVALMDDLKALEVEEYYEMAGDSPPLLMRHTQGDHWDLMLLQYVGSYEDHFSRSRLRSRAGRMSGL